ncbi:MAG: hypothetical protein ACSLE9_07860 [Burkholderiaceae bacterium]
MNELPGVTAFPASRRTDPASSHIAERNIGRRKIRGGQSLHVLELVQAHPGHTATELAALPECRIDRITVSRRLPDVMHAGYIVQGTIRNSAVTDRPEVTWWLYEPPAPPVEPTQGELF